MNRTEERPKPQRASPSLRRRASSGRRRRVRGSCWRRSSANGVGSGATGCGFVRRCSCARLRSQCSGSRSTGCHPVFSSSDARAAAASGTGGAARSRPCVRSPRAGQAGSLTCRQQIDRLDRARALFGFGSQLALLPGHGAVIEFATGRRAA